MPRRPLLLTLVLVAAGVCAHLYLVSAADEIDRFNRDAAFVPFLLYIRGRPPHPPADFVLLRWLGLAP
jgi:hypothetical protein